MSLPLVKYLAQGYFPVDLAFTLNTRRNRFAQRAFTVIRQGQETEAFAETAVRYGAAANKPPSVGYLFTGQGVSFLSFRTTIAYHF